MLHFTRDEYETADFVMERTNRTIKGLIQHLNAETWDLAYHRNVFKFGAWLARLSDFDPSRVTYHVFKHKDWRWIRKIARANSNSQLHGRKLRTWRWERPLYVCAGEHWPDLAMNEEQWDEQLSELLHKTFVTR